jgi:hypothetical protein
MRIVSPGIALCALLGACSGLVLGSCIKPVGVDTFLRDQRVKNLLGTEANIGDIDFEVEDLSPELAGPVKTDSNGVPFIEVSVGSGPEIRATITVENAGDYTEFRWYFNSKVALPEEGATIKLRWEQGSGNPVMDGDETVCYMPTLMEAGADYPATVEGTTEGDKHYSTHFFIKFVK